MAKRTFDLTVTVLLLALLAPLLAVAVVIVLLVSGPPVFCSSWRVGRHGREFRLYRLRTLVGDARKRGASASAGDGPHLTRAGQVLRRTGLDRIPELLSVVRGDLSLVGPHPEDPLYVSQYTPAQGAVLSVRPGIVSAASIAYGDEARGTPGSAGGVEYVTTILPVMLDLDLAYVRSNSFVGDLRILARAGLGVLARAHLQPGSLVLDAIAVVVGFHLAVLLVRLDNPAYPLGPSLRSLDGSLLPVLPLYLLPVRLLMLHRRVWAYAGDRDLGAVGVAAVVGTALTALVVKPSAIEVFLGGGLVLAAMLVVRLTAANVKELTAWWRGRHRPRIRTLIYGAGETGGLIASRLCTGRDGKPYQLVGFIDDDPNKHGLRLQGVRVLGGRPELVTLVERLKADLVILALGNVPAERLRSLVSIAQETTAQIKIVPDVHHWIAASTATPLIREIRVEDLLGRRPAELEPWVRSWLATKVILITGASGSVGSELCRQLARLEPVRLVVVDNNESGVYDLEVELRTRYPALDLVDVVADVTDARRMVRLFAETRPQVVFHAATYKHIPLMERYPEEAVRVNVGGTAAVLAAASANAAERLVLVSTDKAVKPTSVMGCTKRLAEVLISTAGRPSLLCTSVRFGNVLGTRGSVVPTFARQIELGGPVTVTHRDMSRYFMDVSDAAVLILQAAAMTHGGDIFMLDMGAQIRIDDLARRMIRMRGLRPGTDIEINYVRLRPGEKLHEEVTSPGEQWETSGHPRIRRVKAAPAKSGINIRAAVDQLLRLAAANDRERLVSQLFALTQAVEPVSDWSPPGAQANVLSSP